MKSYTIPIIRMVHLLTLLCLNQANAWVLEYNILNGPKLSLNFYIFFIAYHSGRIKIHAK